MAYKFIPAELTAEVIENILASLESAAVLSERSPMIAVPPDILAALVDPRRVVGIMTFDAIVSLREIFEKLAKDAIPGPIAGTLSTEWLELAFQIRRLEESVAAQQTQRGQQ